MNQFFLSLKKDLKAHGTDYLWLLVIGMTFLILLTIFHGQKFMMLLICALLAVSYVLWGHYHHRHVAIAKMKNMVEYILIALTVLIFISIILLR